MFPHWIASFDFNCKEEEAGSRKEIHLLIVASYAPLGFCKHFVDQKMTPRASRERQKLSLRVTEYSEEVTFAKKKPASSVAFIETNLLSRGFVTQKFFF